MAAHVADIVVGLIPTNHTLLFDNDARWAAASLLFSVVLTIIGIQDMYPLIVSLPIYLLALAAILYAVWRAEKLSRWTKRQRLVVLAGTIFAYLAFLAYPIQMAYAREMDINLEFKEFVPLSWWKMQVSRHDIGQYRNYLLNLGLPASKELPAIGVDTRELSNDFGYSAPLGPSLYSDLTIGQTAAQDRKQITLMYGNYVFIQMMSPALQRIRSPMDDSNAWELSALMYFEHFFSIYFNASYWGYRTPAMMLPDYMWNIRTRFGAKFADKFFATSAKTIAGDSSEIKDKDFNVYWGRAFMTADAILDNECSRWPQIKVVMEESGFEVDENKLRATHSSFVSNACIQASAKH
jgi:hypothetical protein